jgi:D-alanyl-D-alanine carboxypeptidase
MFCLITFGMMTTAVSVAELPCSDFASVEPKQQVASLDQSFVPEQPKAPEIKVNSTTVSVEPSPIKNMSLLVVHTPNNTLKEPVAAKHAGKFVCLLNALIDQGYPIKGLGCYSYRYIDGRYTGGVKMLSEHAKGRACDINQEKRNVVSVSQPKNVSDVAHKCGLFSGAEWTSTPDRGHFEVLDGSTPTPPPHWPVTLATYKEKPH